MNRPGEPAKGSRKKQRTQRKEYDVTTTLTDGDLEKIANAVTLDTEDKWVAIEEQQKVSITTIQAELHTL